MQVREPEIIARLEALAERQEQTDRNIEALVSALQAMLEAMDPNAIYQQTSQAYQHEVALMLSSIKTAGRS